MNVYSSRSSSSYSSEFSSSDANSMDNAKQGRFWKPIWPDNLSEICIKEEAKLIIEIVAIELCSRLYRDSLDHGELSDNAVYIRKGSEITLPNHGKVKLPRTLYVTARTAYILLRGHGGMLAIRGGAQRPKIHYVWNLTEGAKYVEKRICSAFEKVFFSWLAYSFEEKPKGFPKVSDIIKDEGGDRILEKYYPYTVAEFYHKNDLLDLEAIARLRMALIRFHEFEYAPPQLRRGGHTMLGSETGGCAFHGDISPNNVMCQYDKDTKNMSLHLIDFGVSASFSTLSYTPGWGSPETLRFCHGMMNITKQEFNIKYGQKRDVWSLGLLIGSILRQDFLYWESGIFPYFNFISKRIKFVDGLVDDSAIMNIDQAEIDKKMDRMIWQVETVYSSEDEKHSLKIEWEFVKRCLRVDPDERPLLMEALTEARNQIGVTIRSFSYNPD